MRLSGFDHLFDYADDRPVLLSSEPKFRIRRPRCLARDLVKKLISNLVQSDRPVEESNDLAIDL